MKEDAAIKRRNVKSGNLERYRLPRLPARLTLWVLIPKHHPALTGVAEGQALIYWLSGKISESALLQVSLPQFHFSVCVRSESIDLRKKIICKKVKGQSVLLPSSLRDVWFKATVNQASDTEWNGMWCTHRISRPKRAWALCLPHAAAKPQLPAWLWNKKREGQCRVTEGKCIAKLLRAFCLKDGLEMYETVQFLLQPWQNARHEAKQNCSECQYLAVESGHRG